MILPPPSRENSPRRRSEDKTLLFFYSPQDQYRFCYDLILEYLDCFDGR